MPQLLLILLILSTGQSRGNTAKLYELADLEILAAEGNHTEFFQHALDIRPSERLDTWRALVSKMADSYGQKTLRKNAIENQDFERMETIFQWPSLKADDVFRLRRNEVGLRYLQSCLKKGPRCWDKVKTFWENDPSDPEVGFKLAELGSRYEGSPFPAWTYLESALKSPLSEFYCQKDLVLDELWKKLELDYFRLGKQGSLVKKIDSTVHPNCLPSLNKLAQRRIFYPVGESGRELAYAILSSQGKMSITMRDFFFTVYLLETPSQGELFNLAWNNLKELGGSPERRDAVFAQIRKLSLLPDKVAGSLDIMKKRVILNHFKANFPEYLDHYAGLCLQYYGGKGPFPEGNPTLHCQELMTSDLGPQIFDSYKVKEFQNIRKI